MASAYVLHILAELDPQAADNVDAMIYGHSHQPKIETKNGTLFFNPGTKTLSSEWRWKGSARQD